MAAERARGRGHYPELDAYRGLAALLIVVFHSYTASGANRGGGVYRGTFGHALLGGLDGAVDAFFVLSGFLVFLPFARAVAGGRPGPTPRAFLVRRAIRILPLYYTMTLLLWPLTTAGTPDAGRNLLAHLAFAQVFTPEHIFTLIGSTWSLSLEVIYYLGLAVLGPALAWCGARLPAGWRAGGLVATPTLLIAASVGYKGWAEGVAGILHSTTIAYGPVARGDAFAIGMLLASVAALRAGRPLIGAGAGRALPLLGLGLIIAAIGLRPRGGWADAYFHTACAVGVLLLLASTILTSPGSAWGRALSWRPLGWLGAISYSLYLCHEIVLVGVFGLGLLPDTSPGGFWRGVAMVVFLACGLATLTYRLVERPALRLRGRWEGATARALADAPALPDEAPALTRAA